LSKEGAAATPFIGTMQKRFQIQSAFQNQSSFKTKALFKTKRFQIKRGFKTTLLSSLDFKPLFGPSAQ
jgi:hypothetical protein